MSTLDRLRAIANRAGAPNPGIVQNYRQQDNLGGYPERCIHGRSLSEACESCERS